MGVMRRVLETTRRLTSGKATWLLLGGLVAIYIGERIISTITPARIVFSLGGVLLVLLVTALRFASWRRASGDARTTEGVFLLAYAGCALSLVLFFLAGDGSRWLGIRFEEATTASRLNTALLVLASILVATSLLMALAAQWAAPASARLDAPTAGVDRLRITQLAAAGLTVGLAGAFLFLLVYVASERDKTLDVGYFRTASPGSAAVQIVESLRSPLRVLLFFEPVNEVKDQVLGYFRALDDAAENVVIELHDRLASPQVAEEHNVVQDGMIILSVGDRTERINMPTEMNQARTRLRTLDEEVQRSLMRVAREERTIYLTTGHGELNDPASSGPLEEAQFRSINSLRSLFRLLNYRVQDLGVQSGLGNEVPSDAAIVLVLGPTRPFLEPELQALDNYLARGGSVLLALEPESDFELGPLRERLGIQYHATPLADDRQHVRHRGNISDRRLVVTDRFSSHAAVSTLSRAGVGSGILLMGAGHIETLPENTRATVIVRSLPTTFADPDLDFEHDEGTEERRAYNLVAVVEDKAAADSEGEGGAGMRALVIADSELFSDAVVSSLGLNAALAADAVRWLGREEELAGETSSEEDVPIVHTRAEDVAWFYSTILGAPSLVLILGLLGVRRRRRRGAAAEDGT